MTVSLKEQIACVRRELALRKSAYAKWVAARRMKQSAADHEIAAMQAVHDTLTALSTPEAVGPTSGELAAALAVMFFAHTSKVSRDAFSCIGLSIEASFPGMPEPINSVSAAREVLQRARPDLAPLEPIHLPSAKN